MDPTFALSACLLVDPATQPFPFTGDWPNLQWSKQLCRATLSSVACKVLPSEAVGDDGPHQAWRAFFHRPTVGGCVKARGHTAASTESLPGEPAFLRGASWRRQEGRWVVQLKMPPSSQHEALSKGIIARFTSTEEDAEQLAIKQADMQDILDRGVDTRTPPVHYLHRLLCWVAHGAPPGSEGKSRLLHGIEGSNLVCHRCREECALCMFTKHLEWGTAKDNVAHKFRSKVEKSIRLLRNLHPFGQGQW